MDVQKKYEHWLNSARYDLDTADAMYASGRWQYVAFMCQQAIEKLCKGLYLFYLDDNIPRIHNISNIVLRFAEQLKQPIEQDRYDFFNQLTALYIDGRYPDYTEQPLLRQQEAQTLLNQTKEAFAWLLTLKP